jgi:hypothetical protein
MRHELRLMDWSIGFMQDVDRDEILSMRVYHQNILTTKIHRCLNYCIGRPAFIVDNAPWLNMHWRS